MYRVAAGSAPLVEWGLFFGGHPRISRSGNLRRLLPFACITPSTSLFWWPFYR